MDNQENKPVETAENTCETTPKGMRCWEKEGGMDALQAIMDTARETAAGWEGGELWEAASMLEHGAKLLRELARAERAKRELKKAENAAAMLAKMEEKMKAQAARIAAMKAKIEGKIPA